MGIGLKIESSLFTKNVPLEIDCFSHLKEFKSCIRENAINWAGFYFRSSQSELLLGPFCGEPACQLLRFNKGVCGEAARDRKTLLVKDVHEFPGHVACDERSNSELVVPVFFKPSGKDPVVIAVLGTVQVFSHSFVSNELLHASFNSNI